MGNNCLFDSRESFDLVLVVCRVKEHSLADCCSRLGNQSNGNSKSNLFEGFNSQVKDVEKVYKSSCL